jgi:hypothetical protein
LFLTAKMGLYCRIWHYGFILAMPAFASAVCLLFWLLPKLLAKHGVHPGLFRARWRSSCFGGLRLFVQSQIIYQDKTIAVGAGGDQMLRRLFPSSIPSARPCNPPCRGWKPIFRPAPRWPCCRRARWSITSRAAPTRRIFSSGIPVSFSMFGQDNMTAAFERHAPDYIMLIHRDGSEYGVKFFGQQPGVRPRTDAMDPAKLRTGVSHRPRAAAKIAVRRQNPQTARC